MFSFGMASSVWKPQLAHILDTHREYTYKLIVSTASNGGNCAN